MWMDFSKRVNMMTIHFLCQYLSKIFAAKKYQVVIMTLVVDTYQPSSVATRYLFKGPKYHTDMGYG